MPVRAQVADFGDDRQRTDASTECALSWVRLPGAEECANLAEISQKVEAYLKRRVLGPPARANTLLEGSIEPRSESGWQVRIRMLDRDGRSLGRRDLESSRSDCREAVEAAALTLALMIDPNAASATEAPEPGAQPSAHGTHAALAASTAGAVSPPRLEQRTAKGAPPSSSGAPDVVEPRPSGWRTRLDLGVVTSVNQLPAPSPGLEGGVRLAPANRGLGLGVTAVYLLPQSAEVRPGAGGRFSQAALGLAGTWSIQPGSTLFAGAELGRLFAKGYGFSSFSSPMTSEWSLNLGAGFELAWTLGQHLGVVLRPRLSAPLQRQRFEAKSQDGAVQQVFRVPILVGSFALAVTYAP